MAGMLTNLKGLFADTRSRTIMLFTTFIILGGIVVALLVLRARTTEPTASARLSGAPSIQSIPGALDPTKQYAKLQEKQNVTQAQTASKTGKSAIPTIIRTEKFAAGQQGLQTGEGGVGFSTLSREARNGGVAKSLWLQNLKQANCSSDSVKAAVKQGATLSDLREVCSCIQLKASGYNAGELKPVCKCTDLKAAGFNALQLKNAGYDAGELNACTFDACQLRSAGFNAEQLKKGGLGDGELKGAGFTPAEIRAASGLPPGMTPQDVAAAGCSVAALKKERAEGVSAAAIRKYAGCSAAALKAAGYTAQELKDAGFTPAELKKAGFTTDGIKEAGCSVEALKKERAKGVTAAAIMEKAGCTADQLKAAGYTPAEIAAAKKAQSALDELLKAGCTPDALKKARAAGISAKTVRDTLGCSAAQMKAGGYTAKELKDAGFTPAELKRAGFTAGQLKAAGFTAKQLADAGFTPKQLKDAGFNASQLKNAGFTAAQLKNAGFSAAQLKNAGFTPDELKKAGYTNQQLQAAGIKIPTSQVPTVDPTTQQQPPQQTSQVTTAPPVVAGAEVTNKALQDALAKQAEQISKQKLQQQVQQRQSQMAGVASQLITGWRSPEQKYQEGTPPKEDTGTGGAGSGVNGGGKNGKGSADSQPALIKAGTIMFAVLDTAVNSDEPGPILATIVSGKYKGTKLIGSFQLPSNADKMIITFNTMSIPTVGKTISINAVGIDPSTARTALASSVDKHILLRYGSLFGSAFLEGFGNAFQSSGTTITLDGSNGATTIDNGVGRTAGENAIIALAKVGQQWGNVLAPVFNTPPTVQVYAGTSIGILFTQDLPALS